MHRRIVLDTCWWPRPHQVVDAVLARSARALLAMSPAPPPAAWNVGMDMELLLGGCHQEAGGPWRIVRGDGVLQSRSYSSFRLAAWSSFARQSVPTTRNGAEDDQLNAVLSLTYSMPNVHARSSDPRS